MLPFSGTASGPVFPGFKYDSEDGAHAVYTEWYDGDKSETVCCYFNGGPQFASSVTESSSTHTSACSSRKPESQNNPHCDRTDTEAQSDSNNSHSCEVLSRYTGVSGNPIAAVVCHVDKGKAVLCGPHYEYIPNILPNDDPCLKNILPELIQGNDKREHCMRKMLNFLGIETKSVSKYDDEYLNLYNG